MKRQGSEPWHPRAICGAGGLRPPRAVLLSYPGAVLFSLDGDAIREIAFRETQHYSITRDLGEA